MKPEKSLLVIIIITFIVSLTLQNIFNYALSQQFQSPWFTPHGVSLNQFYGSILQPMLSIQGQTTPGTKVRLGENETIADISGNYEIQPTWIGLALYNQPNQSLVEIEAELVLGGNVGGKTMRIINSTDLDQHTQDISEEVLDYTLIPKLSTHPELQATFTNNPDLETDFLMATLSSTPEFMAFLPKSCPYYNSNKSYFIFQNNNLLFNPPKWQDIDDASTLVRNSFDGINVLRIIEALVTHDYEDADEGAGGFYSNFHFGVIPYHSMLAQWYEECEAGGKSDTNESCQKLILAFEGWTKRDCAGESSSSKCESEKMQTQGVLNDLYATGGDDFDSSNVHRLHGYLMGPYFTHNTAVALLSGVIHEEAQCEWGDTQVQVPEQTVSYINNGIWDWDYDIDYTDNEKRVHILFWEGDDEKIKGDVIALFDVKRDDVGLGEEITSTNSSGDLSITFATGNTVVKALRTSM